MKTSSADPAPPKPERSKAWTYLITNLLVLPGLGSFLAKHRISGVVQMLLALGGCVVAFVAFVKIALFWVQDFVPPNDPELYHAVIIGIAVFLFSWFWSLATSLTLFRKKP